MTMLRTAATATLACLISTGVAHAQADPKFEFAKPEEVKEVEWKAQASAGLILTTGNSETTTTAGTATASRKADGNKFQLDAALTYARNTKPVPDDINGNGTIDNGDEIGSDTQTTSKAWLVKGRYDRFLTERNSLFATGLISADTPAGKELVGGGQTGYSRLLLKSATHEITGEGGYDFTYEKLVAGESNSIHSLRVFAGYAGALTPETGLTAEIEALFNLNTVDTGGEEYGAFEDTRVNLKTGLTTKLLENISFNFGVKARYDHAPAPRSAFADLPFAAGFVPRVETWDTTTEASLIISFL